jgi:hypothetical protein
MNGMSPIKFNLKRKPEATKTETQIGFTSGNFDSSKSVQPWTKDPDYKIGQNRLRFSTRALYSVNPQRTYNRPKTPPYAVTSEMLSKIGLNLLKSNFKPIDLLSKIEKQENLVTYHPGAMPKRQEKSKHFTHRKHKKSITLCDAEKTSGIIETEPVLDSGLDTPRDPDPETLGASLSNYDTSQYLSPSLVSRYRGVGSRVPNMESMRIVPELLEPVSEKPRSKSRSNRAIHSNHAGINSDDRASTNKEYDDEGSIFSWSVKGIKRLRLDQYKPMTSSRNEIRINV